MGEHRALLRVAPAECVRLPFQAFGERDVVHEIAPIDGGGHHRREARWLDLLPITIRRIPSVVQTVDRPVFLTQPLAEFSQCVRAKTEAEMARAVGPKTDLLEY